MVGPKKVVELMITAPVFILPSRWEGLPISILEAMYLKRGVIVSNVIGNRDIVKMVRMDLLPIVLKNL